jgi:hypothetical protein
MGRTFAASREVNDAFMIWIDLEHWKIHDRSLVR